jgi:hypothetical protein
MHRTRCSAAVSSAGGEIHFHSTNDNHMEGEMQNMQGWVVLVVCCRMVSMVGRKATSLLMTKNGVSIQAAQYMSRSKWNCMAPMMA